MRRLAIVVVLLALSAVSCTSSSSGPRSASGGIRSPIPAKFARAVQHTAIGDLDRLDVCAALAGVRFSRPALRGQPDPIQSPGSCDLTLHGKTAASLFVNVSLDSDDTTDPEATVSGTTRR
ncbi:MAG TPA: hypothetical protein VJ831_08225, partial [Jatrophihabitantaceae bacterium]|nr:hypothetical protein [Jatrophihabitantaceae bacterium]